MSGRLELDGLVVARGGKQVLKSVSITVPRGQITALLGPNGAGKSTTVMTLAGALPMLAGSVRIDGLNVAGWRPEAIRAAGVSVVPEGHRVIPDLSIEDNLALAGAVLPARAVRAAMAEVFKLLPELQERLKLPARQLSGGQKQMVAVAQALISNPRYLVVDELSLGLAPVIVNRLMEAIKDVASRGVGVLLIEQFVALALGAANQAYVLEQGEVAWSGAALELRKNPQILHSSYLGT